MTMHRSDPPRPQDAPVVVRTAVHEAARGAAHYARVHPVLVHADRTWRVAVAQTLEQLLVQSVATLWGGGWQPMDLHRLARRKSKLAADTLRDVMVGELASHDPATVDPRYGEQLSELGATVWWPPRSGPLQARIGALWADLVAAAVTVAALLATLPPIEQHWPPPGRWSARTSRPGVAVDDRVLARVRSLLAKAESTTFEAEAESFTAAAQSLMARHSIDLAVVAAQGPRADNDAPQGLRMGLEPPYEQPKAVLLSVVADANNARVVWAKQWSFCTVVGFPADLFAVQNVFTSLLVQVTAALQRAGSRTHLDGTSRTRSFRVSFLMAFAQRIGERLRAATAEATATASTQAQAAGHDLLPILASRRDETEEAFHQMFPQTRPMRTATVSDQEGWAAGRAAADAVRLAAGEELDRARS